MLQCVCVCVCVCMCVCMCACVCVYTVPSMKITDWFHGRGGGRRKVFVHCHDAVYKYGVYISIVCAFPGEITH